MLLTSRPSKQCLKPGHIKMISRFINNNHMMSTHDVIKKKFMRNRDFDINRE